MVRALLPKFFKGFENHGSLKTKGEVYYVCFKYQEER